MHTTLIDAAGLAEHIGAGDVVVLDCRFSLADTDEGFEQYKKSHLPGAHYVHLDNDLSSAIVEGTSGRHPLPTQEAFIQQLRSWGVNDNTQVFVYDDAGGAIAARAWWLCLWVGHQACAVLNGGFKAWLNQQLPLSTEQPAALAGNATIRPTLTQLIQADQVLDKDRVLLDARAPERYSGEVEPLDKLAGHIPTALNLPFTDNLDNNGSFISADKLKTRFDSVLDQHSVNDVTHYCGSGVTAAHNILAMMHAGIGMSTLYAGSWSEWVQDPSRPTASDQQ